MVSFSYQFLKTLDKGQEQSGMKCVPMAINTHIRSSLQHFTSTNLAPAANGPPSLHTAVPMRPLGCSLWRALRAKNSAPLSVIGGQLKNSTIIRQNGVLPRFNSQLIRVEQIWFSHCTFNFNGIFSIIVLLVQYRINYLYTRGILSIWLLKWVLPISCKFFLQKIYCSFAKPKTLGD